MYHMLTTRELTVLQNVLFGGTEEAFTVASEDDLELSSAERYRATHREIANLFIEAATELLGRLSPAARAA